MTQEAGQLVAAFCPFVVRLLWPDTLDLIGSQAVWSMVNGSITQTFVKQATLLLLRLIPRLIFKSTLP
jgi:hypothetical protein